MALTAARPIGSLSRTGAAAASVHCRTDIRVDPTPGCGLIGLFLSDDNAAMCFRTPMPDLQPLRA
jgi:hypothetical protein